MSEYKLNMPKTDFSRIGEKVSVTESIGATFLTTIDTYGSDTEIARDATIDKMTYGELLARSVLFSRIFSRVLSGDEKNIALMLPTSIAMMSSFMAVQFMGRVATMINFTAGVTAVAAACKTAEIKSLVTSHAFIEKVGLGMVIEAIEGAGVTVLYLEDLMQTVTEEDQKAAKEATLSHDGLRAAMASLQMDDPAVILFTSGSEGVPKGVALSHRNVLSNVAQFTAQLDIGAGDRLFACLPLYHSFGLTVGAILPVLSGIHSFFYPSPLHYQEVPKLIKDHISTLLLTTDTFLTGYARKGNKEDFTSLRYIIAGAEAVKAKTREIWEGQFGKVIFEGYGVTETAPVISVNTPERYRPGSVGPLLKNIEGKIVPIEGIDQGGELWVKGPNVMLGYIRADKPGVIQPPKDGWYNTGDVATLIDDFVTIKGRIKRFAKVGGEMVSLVAIEQVVAQVCPGTLHAVVSVPHARRGEAIVLLSEAEEIDQRALRQAIKETGLSDLSVPRKTFTGVKVPVLGSGKLDIIGAQKLAKNLVSQLQTISAKEAPKKEEKALKQA